MPCGSVTTLARLAPPALASSCVLVVLHHRQKLRMLSLSACSFVLLASGSVLRAERRVGSLTSIAVRCRRIQSYALASGTAPGSHRFGNIGVVAEVSLADGQQVAPVTLPVASLPRFGRLRCA